MRAGVQAFITTPWVGATVEIEAQSPVIRLPTAFGTFQMQAFRDAQGREHAAIWVGDLTVREPILTRIHSECLTGDVFHSMKCDCGPQKEAALRRIQQEGRGILVYLRQEGRDIGLVQKLHAYDLQDQGFDTVDANLELGLPADARTYEIAAAILEELCVPQITLLSNNPDKLEGLRAANVHVLGRVPLRIDASGENADYLRTKKERMGHDL